VTSDALGLLNDVREHEQVRSLLPRLGRLVVVLFLVTLFASLLVSFLPGDPAAVVAPFAQRRAAG
jgi:ABC-type dipeptide/oligopeptide/nickel transport system permease component